jgi:hypothetical protein
MLEPLELALALTAGALVVDIFVVRFVLMNFSDVQRLISEEIADLPLIRRPWSRHLRDPERRDKAIELYHNRLFRVAMTLPVWLLRHIFFLILAFLILLSITIGTEIGVLRVYEVFHPGELFGAQASLFDISGYVVFVVLDEVTAGFFDIFPHILGYESGLVLDSKSFVVLGISMVALKFTVASILVTEIGGDLVSTVKHFPKGLQFAFTRYQKGL